ncbi:rhamnogalacturonan acetylesterase [Mucilaginibacter aquatilis]|uniref:Lysophospholipase n=1 Tax=Mucilaginibacter aquatilis TaxID=1517760 RepID=A0A6I4IBQ1_9SPHI|nr:rhamnogalacturonan acetylesterase [Mucilaginibacter aquatilis]MVN90976.1 lysophospholipase [Mucilaginibacter aquatilis]
MFNKYTRSVFFALVVIAAAGAFYSFIIKLKPTLYLVGDSTVKNGKGKGDGGLWGWGSYLANHFDTTKITVENDALGGTSSRTFQTQGWWSKVADKIKPGDYVIMQFGHNDSSPLVDSSRARGTIKSNGDEQEELYNPLTKKTEVIHSYGWYLRKMIAEAKAKGATVAVCSLIPRNSWKDGKVVRSTDDYGKWAAEAAKQAGATFIDLNTLVADNYDAEGEAKVKSTYFNDKDHTHTIEAGAILNAKLVAMGVKQAKGFGLSRYLKK